MNYTVTLNFADSDDERRWSARSRSSLSPPTKRFHAAVIAEHGREDWTSFVIVGVCGNLGSASMREPRWMRQTRAILTARGWILVGAALVILLAVVRMGP
jgi:hypothetical protein